MRTHRLLPLALGLAVGACMVPKDEDKTPQDNRCTSCHGSASNPGDAVTRGAPPVDTHGNTAESAPGVGAHQRHLQASSSHGAVACDECHVVPASATSTGHNDEGGPNAPMAFGVVATRDGGLSPRYDATTHGCANTYCHGSATVDWTSQRTADAACGTCHGLPPPKPHPQSTLCSGCHPAVIDQNKHFIAPALHVNGVVDVTPTLVCTNCHGAPPAKPHPQATQCYACHPTTVNRAQQIISDTHLNGVLDVVLNPACDACHGHDATGAPPVSLDGGTTSATPGVGAHQAHLTPSASHRTVACTDCHEPVTTVLAPDGGHVDGTVTLPFASTVAVGPRDAGAAYSNGTCTTWCHGLESTTKGSPTWTRQGGALGCADCHGFPPPAPHIQSTRCELCHQDVLADAGFANKDLHVDGVVEVAVGSCNGGCHGTTANAAPPTDTYGSSSTKSVGVGAHQSHLAPHAARAVQCQECHVVPSAVESAGHLNGQAEVAFNGIGVPSDGGVAKWTVGTATCTVACHAPAFFQAASGTNTSPVWNIVDGSQVGCNSCHGYPPPVPHPPRTDCSSCHLNWAAATSRPDLHIDGKITFTVP